MALLWAVAGITATPAARPAAAAGDAEAAARELAFAERLYREGDSYRAHSELLRFLYLRPRHPARDRVQLARAKLFYREGRHQEARLMLFSLLDRYPAGAAAPSARRLLGFSQVRTGDLPEAKRALRGTTSAAALDVLRTEPPGTVDADTAVAWSTWLPGSGYFALGEPGKAVAGLSLNLLLLGAVALSVEKENAGAALLFLVFEAMLYQGGRSGVRQDAEALNRRLRQARTEAWLQRQGEPALLRAGLELRFGG